MPRKKIHSEPSRAEKAIAWCERLIKIPEGRFVGQPLVMAEFMREDFRAIFDNPAGTRRAIITRGRKNAKTVETALLMLIYLCGPEAKPNSQLFSAARSRDQASVLFALAAKMVRMSADLSSALVIRDSAKEIVCPELGSKYKAISAEASTAFGLSPRFVAHDELGQVRGPRDALYGALETASAAQDAPLSVIISTQAPTDADLLSILIDDAKRGEDPRTVLRIDAAPDDMDVFSMEAIRAANPAFDIFMNQQEVLDMMKSAERMPTAQAEYENYVLNKRVNLSSPFMTRQVWEGCAGEADPEAFELGDVYIGLDLSSRNDLTAIVAVAKDARGVWQIDPYFFAPLVGLHERAKRDRVPYDLWEREGWIIATPGASVDYDLVAKWLAEYCSTRNVIRVNFDRWRIDVFKAALARIDAALPLEPFGQGFRDMTPALDALESEFANKSIIQPSHPVLTMCASNAVSTKDPAGGRKLDKSKATGRIDGMVALAMAMGGASQAVVAPKPAYSVRWV